MDWATRNPHLAVAIVTGGSAVLLFLGRFGLSRHREFIAFTNHMRREETEVWPTTIEAVRALDAKTTRHHEEMLRQFSRHGERLAKVEARMPNGEIDAIKRMVEQLLTRKA